MLRFVFCCECVVLLYVACFSATSEAGTCLCRCALTYIFVAEALQTVGSTDTTMPKWNLTGVVITHIPKIPRHSRPPVSTRDMMR